MTATEELRRMLDERGVEWSATVGANGTIWTHWDAFNGQRIHAMDNEDGTVEIFDQWDLTPEQAIAATLGPRKQLPYDELIEALRRDWEIEASWDGLRRFWYVGWTDEHVRRCESVNLDQDWVRDLIERHSDASGGNGRDFHNGAYVAIADELNATLGSCNCSNSERTGTCHNASKVMDEHGQARFACSECHAWIDSRMLWNPEYRNGESPWVSGCKLNFCPNCGRRIVDPTTNDVDAEVGA